MGRGRGGTEIHRLEVAAGDFRHRGRDAVRIDVDIGIGGPHKERAGGFTCGDVDVALVGDNGDVRLARIAQIGGEGDTLGVLIHILNTQAHRGGIDGVGDLGCCGGGAEIHLLEVAPGDAGNRSRDGVRINVDIRIGGAHKQRAGGLTCGDGDVALVGDNSDIRLTRIAQIGGEGDTLGVFIHILNTQAHRGRIDGIGDLGRGRGGTEIHRLEVAAGDFRHRGRDAVRIDVDIGIGGPHKERAGGFTCGDVDVALVGDNGDVRLARIAQIGGEGDTLGVLIHILNTQAHRGGIDGVGDLGCCGGGAEIHCLEIAPGHLAHRGRDGVRIDVDVGIGGAHKQRPGGLPCGNGNVAEIGGNRHIGLARIAQRGGKGDAIGILIHITGSHTHGGGINGILNQRLGGRGVVNNIIVTAAIGVFYGCENRTRINVGVVRRGVNSRAAGGFTHGNFKGRAIGQGDHQRRPCRWIVHGGRVNNLTPLIDVTTGLQSYRSDVWCGFLSTSFSFQRFDGLSRSEADGFRAAFRDDLVAGRFENDRGVAAAAVGLAAGGGGLKFNISFPFKEGLLYFFHFSGRFCNFTRRYRLEDILIDHDIAHPADVQMDRRRAFK